MMMRPISSSSTSTLLRTLKSLHSLPSYLPTNLTFTRTLASNARMEEVRSVVHQRMQGRRRFYKTVGVVEIDVISYLSNPSAPPLSTKSESITSITSTVDDPESELKTNSESAASAISAGVDGTSSGVLCKIASSTSSLSPLSLVTPNLLNPGKLFAITLDGKKVNTPARYLLALPSESLAYAVATEWDMQREVVEPSQMPLMGLSCTSIDQIASISPGKGNEYEYVIENVMRYLGNDTTCYYTDPKSDRVLARQQSKKWDSIHTFAAKPENLNGEPFRTNEFSLRSGGLPHPPNVFANAEIFLRGLNSWELAAMQSITMEAKSFLVGLSLLKDHISTKQAIEASRVEEEFQLEVWGLVEGGHDFDRLNCSIQITAAKVFLDLLK